MKKYCSYVGGHCPENRPLKSPPTVFEGDFKVNFREIAIKIYVRNVIVCIFEI